MAIQQHPAKPRIKLASMSAVFPGQKPTVIFPEINKTTPPASAEKRQEIEPKTKDYLGTLLEWSAGERVLNDEERRGRNIVIVGGGCAIVLGALFIGNYLLGIFIALAVFVLYVSGGGKSKVVKCAITPQGVKIENRVYEFSDIKSFWIFYDPADIKELSLESKKTMMPQIRAPLGDTDPIKLRETLLKFIPEKKHEESLTDIIGRKFFG